MRSANDLPGQQSFVVPARDFAGGRRELRVQVQWGNGLVSGRWTSRQQREDVDISGGAIRIVCIVMSIR